MRARRLDPNCNGLDASVILRSTQLFASDSPAKQGLYPPSAIATPTMTTPNATITNAVIQGEIPLR